VLKAIHSRTFLPILLLAILLAAAGAYRWLFTDLPSLDRLTENLTVPSTKIMARDGRLLYQITDPAGLNHTTVALAEIPEACQQATIATEDATFYSNPGVDLVGIVRAIWINVRGGETLAGGSTITQQVARNMLLDPQERAERTLTRKLRESILAWRMARAFEKDEVLSLYLNQTYYGNLAHGMETAAQTYYGKSVRDLDLAECALLAGLPQAPAFYDPLVDLEAANARQEIVLGLLARADYITEEEAARATNEPLRFASSRFPVHAPHFAFYVWNLIEARYGPEFLYSGLNIRTTIDLDLTSTAEGFIARHLEKLAEDTRAGAHDANNAALIALDPHSGQILAMVGSADYFDAEISGAINMALAARQPGSTLKPITYAATFDPQRCPQGAVERTAECPWTPATMILDIRTSFVTAEGLSYVPQNYDRAYHGPVLAREALAASLNVPAVIALDEVGLPNMLRLAGEMGLTTLSDADRFGLALALGGGEVRLLDLVSAYDVFASGGLRYPPTAILEVSSANGEIIEQWQPRSGARILDERIAYLITDILSDNAARLGTFGEFSLLDIGRPSAVKTGTTTDFRDNWTVGYTPELVAGVWVGNADNSPMLNITGVDGAAPIWHDFMRTALQGKPETSFSEPSGMVRMQVCALSGDLPTDVCPHRRSELFLSGTEPDEYDSLYKLFELDAATGQLATDETPADRIVEQVFLTLPPEAQDWARERGIPALPEAITAANETLAPLEITSPDEGTVYQLSALLPEESQQIRIRVVAQEPVTEITIMLNEIPIAILEAAPFQTLWTLVAGVHEVYAIGRTTVWEELRAEAVRFVVNPPE